MPITSQQRALRNAVVDVLMDNLRDGYDPHAASLIIAFGSVIEGVTVEKALGAPGSWGYGTPIGDALLAHLQSHGQDRCDALASILAEREAQVAKWGPQNHTLGNWGLILMEEVGEWSEAALHTQFGGPKADGLRKEIVQVAAVALQIVQWLDSQTAG